MDTHRSGVRQFGQQKRNKEATVWHSTGEMNLFILRVYSVTGALDNFQHIFMHQKSVEHFATFYVNDSHLRPVHTPCHDGESDESWITRGLVISILCGAQLRRQSFRKKRSFYEFQFEWEQNSSEAATPNGMEWRPVGCFPFPHEHFHSKHFAKAQYISICKTHVRPSTTFYVQNSLCVRASDAVHRQQNAFRRTNKRKCS